MSQGLLSAAWEFYEAHLVPKDASRRYRCDAHTAFYSGASVVLECLRDRTGLSENDTLTNLQRLDSEIQSFSAQCFQARDDETNQAGSAPH